MDKTVLIYIKNGDDYLFMYRSKKKNDINHDKWIGIGGHIEDNETKEEAVIREVKEETGLTLLSMDYRGEILFKNNDFEEIMFLFTSSEFTGELKSCDEGELHWVNKSKINDLNLWDGDRIFLPILLSTNQAIKMSLIYNEDRLIQVIDESEGIR